MVLEINEALKNRHLPRLSGNTDRTIDYRDEGQEEEETR